MQIILANPRGFCAGVDRAIDIVERALELFGAPIFVRHEVVHNHYVVNDLKKKGAIFVEELSQVPDNRTVIFSAHGVPLSVRDEAKKRGLQVFDATCPLVTKVHMEVSSYIKQGREVILIGHKGHPEVEGTMGQYKRNAGDPEKMFLVESPQDVDKLCVANPDHLSFVTQTTLSVDDTKHVIHALRTRFSNILGPKKDDICYATQNRQDAVKQLLNECDLILVVGSTTSSNSNRLREIAINAGVEAYLIDGSSHIKPEWLTNKAHIGITAGASAPEILVQEVVDYLQSLGAELTPDIPEKLENIVFSLPKSLQKMHIT